MMVFTNKYVYEDGFELNFFFSLNKKEREKGEGRREKGEELLWLVERLTCCI